jgi:hypothetical protein
MPDSNTLRHEPEDAGVGMPPLPITETHQPDPMLQITTGRAGVGSLTLVAVAIALVLGVVFYGLNNGRERAPQMAATSSTTQNASPPAGGKEGPAAPGTPRANPSGVKG